MGNDFYYYLANQNDSIVLTFIPIYYWDTYKKAPPDVLRSNNVIKKFIKLADMSALNHEFYEPNYETTTIIDLTILLNEYGFKQSTEVDAYFDAQFN